ncbi:unnamed protein product [Urochloa decumbens]|uniref:Uncharacterized protein n=1 Tax=Urochloa decumbens TaxID=240449 RepID=A0ABC9AKJ6_9POAL
MTRILHYLMATSLVVLVMISSNSTSCQACLFPGCRPPTPCFKVLDKDCTELICQHICGFQGKTTTHAYCKSSKKMCCCPGDI